MYLLNCNLWAADVFLLPLPRRSPHRLVNFLSVSTNAPLALAGRSCGGSRSFEHFVQRCLLTVGVAVPQGTSGPDPTTVFVDMRALRHDR